MGYISRYLKVFQRCGKVIGPTSGGGRRKEWKCLYGHNHFRFWQNGNVVGRDVWAVHSSPAFEPWWMGLEKDFLFNWVKRAFWREPYELTPTISGRILVESWSGPPTLVLQSYLLGPGYWANIRVNDPVAVRMWGDHLHDGKTKPYLIDYLLDLSEPFRSWYRP